MNLFRGFYGFARDIYENRFVLGQLVKRDFKNRYLGSFLGFLWTIIQPIVMIVVLWAVFILAFNSGPVIGPNGQEIPFIAWFAIGVITWNFFAEACVTSTNVFQEYSYLVKKINFKIAILPIVKLLSSFVTHLVFLAIIIGILLFKGVPITLQWVQVIYYVGAMMMLLLGLSWITSCLQVFIKDITQLVGIVLQFGFWLTPIAWNFSIVPQKWQFWFKLNPMFYIIDGYRKSFLFEQWAWEDQQLMGLYFWLVTFIILIIVVVLFRKLRPSFADVL